MLSTMVLLIHDGGLSSHTSSSVQPTCSCLPVNISPTWEEQNELSTVISTSVLCPHGSGGNIGISCGDQLKSNQHVSSLKMTNKSCHLNSVG